MLFFALLGTVLAASEMLVEVRQPDGSLEVRVWEDGQSRAIVVDGRPVHLTGDRSP